LAEFKQLNVKLNAAIYEAFIAACTRNKVSMSGQVKQMIMDYIAGSWPEEFMLEECKACGKQLMHMNKTMAYCSHECAGITRLPRSILVGHTAVISNTGVYGHVSVGRDAVSCIICNKRVDPGHFFGEGAQGVFCLKHAVLLHHRYQQQQQPHSNPQMDDAQKLLDMIKQGIDLTKMEGEI
jgi:hypothetical protein